MKALAVWERGPELIERHERAAARRPRPAHPGVRQLALAGVIASLLIAPPAFARSAASGTKPPQAVPTGASVPARESPYVRMARQHREASGARSATADAQPPPKLAGQVQRR